MRRNAFGQLIPCNIRFVNDPDSGAGGGEPKEADPGFPKDTLVADMTPEQQVAYWKDKARKHEGTAKARGDYDDLKAKADKFDEAQRKAESEHEKKLREAAEAARREGENIGAQRYLRDAVRGELRASTGKSNADLEAVMAVIDPAKFVKDDGDIDTDKLTAFAAAFGITQQQQPDPVREALRRNSKDSKQSGGSVSAIRKQRLEQLQKTNS